MPPYNNKMSILLFLILNILNKTTHLETGTDSNNITIRIDKVVTLLLQSNYKILY